MQPSEKKKLSRTQRPLQAAFRKGGSCQELRDVSRQPSEKKEAVTNPETSLGSLPKRTPRPLQAAFRKGESCHQPRDVSRQPSEKVEAVTNPETPPGRFPYNAVLCNLRRRSHFTSVDLSPSRTGGQGISNEQLKKLFSTTEKNLQNLLTMDDKR